MMVTQEAPSLPAEPERIAVQGGLTADRLLLQLGVDDEEQIPAGIHANDGVPCFLVPAGIHLFKKGSKKASAAYRPR